MSNLNAISESVTLGDDSSGFGGYVNILVNVIFTEVTCFAAHFMSMNSVGCSTLIIHRFFFAKCAKDEFSGSINHSE